MSNHDLARQVTEHLGGEWHGCYGIAPGPGHSKNDRSLRIQQHRDRPNNDVKLHSYADDSWEALRDLKDELLNRMPRSRPRPRRAAAGTQTSYGGCDGQSRAHSPKPTCASGVHSEVCRCRRSTCWASCLPVSPTGKSPIPR